jgi:peptidoglycan/xylan/chitin deacetylase (PgdA/CDA1 family)
MLTSPIAININFDSLNENLGFPQGFRDPSYFEVFDSFMEFSTKYNFKYSIYMIGRDLENPEISARVRDWSQMGHEIGNHSYTHHLNIGGLKKEKLEHEIMKSHELIGKTTGKAPRGFICPGWSTSKKVIEILIENNYLYDTSLFPSLIMYPSVLKNAFNHIGHKKKFKEIVSRRDYLFPLYKPLTPFYADKNFKTVNASAKEKILIMPLPTISRFSFSMWHTLIFIFGVEKSKKRLSNYLNHYKYFYYLMHPADLMDIAVVKDTKHTIERMEVSYDVKANYVTEAFELIKQSKRPIVTMEQLALNFIAESVAKPVKA